MQVCKIDPPLYFEARRGSCVGGRLGWRVRLVETLGSWRRQVRCGVGAEGEFVEAVGVAEVKGLEPGKGVFAVVDDDGQLAGGADGLPGAVLLVVVEELRTGA